MSMIGQKCENTKERIMKLALILYSNDSETVWNALRLGIFSLDQQDNVEMFLLGKGVEIQQLNQEKFNISEQLSRFIEKGGKILACGTCLKLRETHQENTCEISTLKDLHTLITTADKVLTF